MLLHWTFGACAALADTICIEPTGHVAYEKAEDPCAAHVLEKADEQSCVDLQAHDGHDNHSPVPAKLQLVDAQSAPLIPALPWRLPHARTSQAIKPDATGPPSTAHSVLVRETSYLLI